MFNIEHSKVYTIVHISNGFSVHKHLRKIKIMCCHQTINIDAYSKPTFASEISKISKKVYKNSFWFYIHVEKVPWANMFERVRRFVSKTWICVEWKTIVQQLYPVIISLSGFGSLTGAASSGPAAGATPSLFGTLGASSGAAGATPSLFGTTGTAGTASSLGGAAKTTTGNFVDANIRFWLIKLSSISLFCHHLHLKIHQIHLNLVIFIWQPISFIRNS